jgi:uncharacterized membrane protein
MPDSAAEFQNLQRAVADLSVQVAQLQERVVALEEERSSVVPAPHVQSAAATAPNPPEFKKLFEHRDISDSVQWESEGLESRLGLTTVNRIGAITLAIGIVFLFKYAVDNNWITAWSRVVLGVLSGLVLIVVADWLHRRDQRVFSQGICGCGLAILYISLYASFAYYQLVPQMAAFAAMVGACALAVFLSFRYDHPAMAALGLIGGVLTPQLLEKGQDHPWLLFPYLVILDVFSLGIARRKAWPVLHVLAFAGTAALFIAWASLGGPSKTGVGVLFLCTFFALFFVASVHDARCPGERTTGLILLPLNAFWVLLSTRLLSNGHDPEWIALFAVALASVHFGAAFSLAGDQRVYRLLYVTGHACLVEAIIRELYTWATQHVDALARASFLSESVSVSLALYALGMITSGIVRKMSVDRVIGLVLVGIVVCKLYLYDVWLLSRFYRISAFITLGTLLLIASYVYSRFRRRLDLFLK